MKLRLLFLVALAASSPALAEANEDRDCRNFSFPLENPSFGLAEVQGAARAYFLNDMNGCPNQSAQCRARGYVIPGNRVLTGRSLGDYICVYYPSRGGGTAGWIEKRRLRPIPADAIPPLSAWLGRWSDEGNPAVRFFMRKGELRIEGESYWPSPNPPRNRFPGGPNMGDIDEVARRSGNQVHSDECNVNFTMVGDLLVVSDPDMKCGGMNVSFTGVYRHMPK